MSDQFLIIIAAVLFLAVGLFTKNRNTKKIESFATRRNKLTWFVTSAGVSMTFVGGAALLNMSSLGYSYKWYTLIDPIAFMAGIIIAALLVKKYRNGTGITISQLLSGSSKKLSLYIGLISSTVFLLIISAQFVAFSKLLAPYFPGVDPFLLMIIPCGIILLYVFIGGFAAVTNTDVLQLFFIFIFLLIPFCFYLLTNQSATFLKQNDAVTFLPMPLDLIVYLVLFVLFVPISQEINVRAKSAINERHAKIGILLGGIYYCLIVIACSYIGITLAEKGIKMNDPEQTFPTFFKLFYPTIGIFPILAGMAAIWSTLDTYLVTCITSVSEDIFKKTHYFKNWKEGKLIILVGIIVYSLALIISIFAAQVLYLVLTALLMYISVLIPIALAKKIKINDDLILIFSFLTSIIILVCEVQKFEVPVKGIIYPVAALAIMLAGKLYQTLLLKTTKKIY